MYVNRFTLRGTGWILLGMDVLQSDWLARTYVYVLVVVGGGGGG